MNIESSSRSRASIASAIESDYSAMLDEMKGLDVMGAKIGTIECIEDMTPGQLYDETYRRVLNGTIKELQLKLKEFS